MLFPCIGYAQEKDTIPSMDIEEEESINTTCFPSMEQKPMFVQCKDVSVRERDSCFYHFFSQYLKQNILKSPYKELEGGATAPFQCGKGRKCSACPLCDFFSVYKKRGATHYEAVPKTDSCTTVGKACTLFLSL